MTTPALPQRRTLLLGLLATGSLPLLQGCFPIVATGVGAGAAMVSDRRTSGAYVEDEAIEWKIKSRIAERFGDSAHVNVTSYNRIVLLTGEAPNEASRSALDGIASGVENVTGLVNEVAVGPNSSLSARANDTLITSNVKARFVDAQRFSAHNVKVVTEANVVFLLGLVTRAEADAAAEIASTSKGVRKVVRVFEYISDDEARRLDNRLGTAERK
ncbi:MAG: BON domain-containing protein [Thauera phenolivorans]|uniref:BON domain-containing protein n=1 Tax=Thauera phenolivorans TaxID=1792543 RepID=A0A7X7LUT6_9RHOO|nr:BON domain-containing protein [Thauera phenolivorans]NLF53791.1 BON domain-containing protein [Thauera phenolivorans]